MFFSCVASPSEIQRPLPQKRFCCHSNETSSEEEQLLNIGLGCLPDVPGIKLISFTAERTDRDFLIHLWCQNYTKAFYKGFLFRAIQKKGRTESYFNGHFIRDTRSPDVRFVRCDDTPDSAVTHIDSSRKNETYVRWVPHERPFHPVVVVFRATIVQQRVIYWMGVDTKVVLVGSASSSTSTWILFIIVPLSARLFKTYYC
ncbi:uncharacterized protein LOC135393833 isoform X4 [Ornithodoros turicata]|uniref:uncharacterized protein LOC135393833 isoform X4 n=1 Tax=Ornithodoros turicata TaxID=34597 RepID=UPI0031398DAC